MPVRLSLLSAIMVHVTNSPPLTSMASATEDIAQLLGRACTMTEALNEAHSRTPILACLSFGIEQLLKLTLGLMDVHDGKPWPDMSARSEYGHNLCKLDAECRVRFAASDREDIRDAVAALNADTTVTGVIAAADNYARAGRYFFLNALGKVAKGEPEPPPDDSPAELWEDMVRKACDVNPDMLARLATLPVPPDDPAHRELNAEIVRAIRHWWSTYRRAWQSGLLGPDARTRSYQLELVPFWSQG